MTAALSQRSRLGIVVTLLLFSLSGCDDDGQASATRIAVAANFAATAEALREAHLTAGGAPIDLIVGSTGGLGAQITSGAPFDAFLAADTVRPDRLIAAELAQPDSRFIYAIGRLVLWSPRVGFVDDAGQVLRGRAFDHLAVADPATAPYGAAARAYLRHADLDDALAPRLVTGQSVGQAYQFTASGNADLGFVALSQVAGTGSVFIIPEHTYPSLAQAAVLLTDHPTARVFLDFIRHDPAAHAIIAAHGYRLPAAESRTDARRR